MSASGPAEGARGARILCLGEALVDLICERSVETLAQADRFVPHFGGAVANVAVIAARGGARVALAGGAGDDAWGAWLVARLRREGVHDELFELVPGSRTLLALIAISADGEPSYEIYGDAVETIVDAMSERLGPAVDEAAALFISTNTMVGAGERAVTRAAPGAGPGLEGPG